VLEEIRYKAIQGESKVIFTVNLKSTLRLEIIT